MSVPRNLELGEVYDDELQGEGWVDTGGKRQPFPAMSLGVASIVASTPIDQWKPTREEYEGYTGNAGNTLDRWYHRSAGSALGIATTILMSSARRCRVGD